MPQASRNDTDFANEREILYKVLFDMKNDLNDLKKLTLELLENGNSPQVQQDNQVLIHRIYGNDNNSRLYPEPTIVKEPSPINIDYDYVDEATEEERFSLQEQEKEMIVKSLSRNEGKRKEAAKSLGISERTLYRKIKQYNLEG